MHHRPLAPFLLVLLFGVTGCDGGTGPATDASTPGTDSGVTSETDGGSTTTDGGHPGTDGGSAIDGGGPGPACEPTAGSDTVGGYCDQFELALFDDGEGNVEARLHGRLMPDGLASGGCAAVDSVEIQAAGATIGTWAGVGPFNPSSQDGLIARAAALPEMTSRCEGDTERFSGFGFIVRGRMDGGSFEARCADAEGGGRWPPALVVTCHENVDEQASFGNYVTVDEVGGFTFTSIDLSMPHGPGGAITSVDSTLHVIPHADPWSGGIEPDPFDIEGFDTSVYESTAPSIGAYTSIQFSKMEDALGEELCPTYDPDTDPLVPLMMVRLTGVSEHGAFRTEAMLEPCYRTSTSL